MTILEPKKEKKIFLKIYFFSKMLNFQDFSKFSKILKSTVQYLSRDISNVKIGQLLRQSRKKHWKTLFCPTAFKIKKIKKFDIPSHKFFEYLSSKKKILKIGPPQIGVWRGSLAVDTLLCPYLYVCTCMYVLGLSFFAHQFFLTKLTLLLIFITIFALQAKKGLILSKS